MRTENWSRSQFNVVADILPNGNIRFHLDDYKKTSLSELQIINPRNVANTIIAGGAAKVYLIDED